MILFIALSAIAVSLPLKSSAQQYVTMQDFYDKLGPYGQWVEMPQFGYVFVPNAGPYFRPYQTAGHWEYTEYGSTWISDYEWGWAAFHYGRWGFDRLMGWFWVPDTQWGPAWVCWRSTPGYYGWAPLGPGQNAREWNRYDYVPYDHWCFVNERMMYEPRVYEYYEPRDHNELYVRRATIIEVDNRGYVYGPRREEIVRATHREIVQRELEPEYRPREVVVDHNHSYRPSERYVVSRARVAPMSRREESHENAVHREARVEKHNEMDRREEKHENVERRDEHKENREGEHPSPEHPGGMNNNEHNGGSRPSPEHPGGMNNEERNGGSRPSPEHPGGMNNEEHNGGSRPSQEHPGNMNNSERPGMEHNGGMNNSEHPSNEHPGGPGYSPSPNSNNNGPRGGSSGQSGQQERSTQHNSQSSQHSGSSQKSSPKPSTSKPIHGNTK